MAGLTKEQRAERAKRMERVPIGAGNKLGFEGSDPDYSYRWVNDRPGRLQMFQRAGWEFCTAEVREADNGIAETSAMDSRVVADGGGGDKLYLMKIRKEFFDEDQAAKIEKVRAIEQSMKNVACPNTPRRAELKDE